MLIFMLMLKLLFGLIQMAETLGMSGFQKHWLENIIVGEVGIVIANIIICIIIIFIICF